MAPFGIFSSAAASPSNMSDTDKPLPEPKRPGTSGTELVLVTNRRQASAKLKAASQAERAYKARKRTAAARANLAEAKSHFGETFRHVALGSRLFASVIRSIPYVFTNKAEQRRAKAAESKRAAAAEKHRKLEEQLAREKELLEAEAEAAAALDKGKAPAE